MIKINLDKAKVVAHSIRREARAAEFAPFDEAIAKRIPGPEYVGAEDQRQLIRNKYAALQTQMDAATTVDELTQLLPQRG